MNSHPIKVLLIDDDEDDFVLTRSWLWQIESTNLELDWVNNYPAAIDALTQPQHDIYLLDYRLGEHNGLELLQQAVNLGCTAPIILLTGQGDHDIDIEAMKAGAADYLEKSQITAPLLERSIRYALERNRSEQKIRQQAALLDVATDAIFVRNLDNQILFWNKGAERLYGWNANDAIGKNCSTLWSEANISTLQIALNTVRQSGAWQGELQQTTKSGTEIIVESRWTLVHNFDYIPQSILIVNTNITAKKQLEAQFLRAQRLESIGTLASGIAHDLNNILAPILMTAQLLEMQLKDERSQRLLPILTTNAKRGATLVKQVLSFARGIDSDSHPTAATLRPLVSVKHLILETQQIIKETFPKTITITSNISPDLLYVAADATQLHQVLMNLCVNARDALLKPGNLTISAENIFIDENFAQMYLDARVGAYVVITVTDTGMGIPPELLDRIFEPFFTTKEHGQGTGLGLATVIGIVKSHGGFVRVLSQVGKGTEFKVYLPAATTPDHLEAENKDIPPGHGELILIVDDEADIRNITQKTLEAYNYRTVTASDGIEAIALYAENQQEVSLVLTDMAMPDMDGITTIRTLQKIDPNVKIIAISGTANKDNLKSSHALGIQAFITKPYTAKELLQTISHVSRVT